MQRWLDALSIDHKLLLIILWTAGAAVVVACLTFVATDSLSTYRSVRSELETMAGIVANSSVSALSFEDAEVAQETLAGLASSENILAGCLYDAGGAELARYTRGESHGACPPHGAAFPPRLRDGALEMRHAVRFQDERLGELYLRSDLSRLTGRLVPYAVGSLLALGLSGGLALGLAARLKNLITRPILGLADSIDHVSTHQDYSIRVQGSSRDEIGQLIEGFNEMLAQVELRDGELRKAQNELEQRVIERTAELEVARDAAQAANRAKSEFLANMSHEIRTPLNAILGLTEVTMNSDLDETQRDHLSTVRDSADSLLGILNDILDFSKIEAGKLDLEQISFNVFDTVDDTLTSLAMRADQERLELACHIDPELPRQLVGDPGRLRQVLTNLVSNAIKFTEQGEVVVRVRPQQREGDSLWLEFTVTDTGIGISPQHLHRLFDPFEQEDSSTTRRFGGTGLGLAISRQLVDLMGGELSAESTPGRGSCFRFTARLTLREGSHVPLRPPLQALDGARVLIVDDNETNREILEQIARARGMRPDGAASAEEGLQRLVEAQETGDPYRLLLSDVHMPGQDGYTLVERIRKDRRLDALQVIFLTSAGSTGDLARCEALRVAARLVKPVRQSELLQVVNRALGVNAAGGPGEGGRRSFGGETPAVRRLPPLRILLVDDSAANRKVAFAQLQGQGHTISVAETGREALQRLAEADYDVVLMDVQMPEMDGFEATAALRAREQGSARHTPVIAMTAHALQGDREKCLEAGMDDYVSKPIRRDDLFGALADAIATGSDRAPRPRRAAPADDPERIANPWTHLLAQVGGDRGALRDIVESHLGEIRDHLDRIPGLIEQGDTAELRRRAHTLKGAMALFGSARAQQDAAELQALAEGGDLADAERHFEQLRGSIARLLPELVAFVETGDLSA